MLKAFLWAQWDLGKCYHYSLSISVGMSCQVLNKTLMLDPNLRFRLFQNTEAADIIPKS